MQTICIVLDTNVVVSAHLNATGHERHVLDLALSRRIRLAVSANILAEYEGVLRRPKFAIAPKHIAKSMRLLRSVSRIVNPQRELRVTHDPDDNRFLECAEAARADYLVTGNKQHFPRNWRQTLVVNAKELIECTAPELRR